MTLANLITASAATIIILLMLYIAEHIARRQADDAADQLRAHLEDAISCELDQHEEIERLRQALASTMRQRNAANLRAVEAARSIKTLPILTVRCNLKEAGPVPFNLN